MEGWNEEPRNASSEGLGHLGGPVRPRGQSGLGQRLRGLSAGLAGAEARWPWPSRPSRQLDGVQDLGQGPGSGLLASGLGPFMWSHLLSTAGRNLVFHQNSQVLVFCLRDNWWFLLLKG